MIFNIVRELQAVTKPCETPQALRLLLQSV